MFQKKHHLNICKITITSVLLFGCFHAKALLSYKYSWVKIKSDHFTILVDKDYKNYGESVAVKAEEAFRRLQSFSTKHPKNTFIIIDHTKGYSNGSATFFPYPIITLQPVTPSASSSVGQYKDWLLELLIHEYTHILSFHNTKGLFTPLRWILGSSVSPGYFLPRWYQEGIAVYTETQLSNGGRLRTSSFKALKNNLKGKNVSIANEQNINHYPFGSNPYIYGGWLNQDLLKDSGIKAASKLHRRFSGRLPYTVNGAYKRTIGKSVYKSWRENFGAKSKESVHYKNQKQGEQPFWDKNSNSLFYIKRDPYGFHQLIKRNSGNGGKKENTLFTKRNIFQFKVFANKIYYTALNLEQQDHELFSLFVFDLNTKKQKKIIFQNADSPLNIKDFDINEDSLLFITSDLKEQNLYSVKRPSDVKQKINFNSPLASVNGETRLAFPLKLSTNEIFYTLKNPDGKEQLIKLNTENNKSEKIFSADHFIDLKQNSFDAYALFENKGNKFLYDISSKKVSRVPQGVLSISPQEKGLLTVSQITQKGTLLFNKTVLELSQESATNDLDYPIKDYVEGLKNKKSNLEAQISNYSSFQKLKPHYIIPSAAVSPYGFSGEFSYGLSTGGQDPLGLNSYSLSASTDSITEEVSYGLNYTSRHFLMPINFNGGVFNQPLSLEIFRKSTYAAIGTSYLFRSGFGSGLSLNAAATADSTEFSGSDIKRTGLLLDAGYNKSELRARELAPRKGYSINLGVEHYLEGSDLFAYTQTYAGLRKYFTSPLHKNHRLLFGVDAQINDRSLGNILFTTSSQNQPYRNISPGGFALRGLPTGSLFSQKSYVVGHLEYRFPIVNIDWGPGLLPGFFRRVTAAFTADYGSVEGANLLGDDPTQIRIDHSTPLYSAGGELIFEGSVFYHVPASLQIGLYKFLNSDVYSGSPEIFVGFGFSGLPF